MKDYRMSLVISFVLKLKGDDRIDGDGLWSCLLLSSLWKYVGKWGHTWKKMDEYRERWNEQDYFLIPHIFLYFV